MNLVDVEKMASWESKFIIRVLKAPVSPNKSCKSYTINFYCSRGPAGPPGPEGIAGNPGRPGFTMKGTIQALYNWFDTKLQGRPCNMSLVEWRLIQ